MGAIVQQNCRHGARSIHITLYAMIRAGEETSCNAPEIVSLRNKKRVALPTESGDVYQLGEFATLVLSQGESQI